jgi:hypothetical protein
MYGVTRQLSFTISSNDIGIFANEDLLLVLFKQSFLAREIFKDSRPDW